MSSVLLSSALIAICAVPPFQPKQGMEQPLDLATVAQRLSGGVYARPLDLATDAARMFSSCAAPFPEGSPQRQAVQQMQGAFEALWQQLMAPFGHY